MEAKYVTAIRLPSNGRVPAEAVFMHHESMAALIAWARYNNLYPTPGGYMPGFMVEKSDGTPITQDELERLQEGIQRR